MTLTIADLSANDYGTYKCVATHTLNTAQKYMDLGSCSTQLDHQFVCLFKTFVPHPVVQTHRTAAHRVENSCCT